MSDEIVRSVRSLLRFASPSGAWLGRGERYVTVVFILNGFLQFLLDLVCSDLLKASANENVVVYELNF